MSLRTRRRPLALLFAFALVAAGCTSSDSGGDGGPGSDGPGTTGSGDTADVAADDGTYRASIVRTDGGVPHITGATLGDVTFGQGWASGEDHTCDLADQVPKVKGERARWLGAGTDDENIESDVAWRAIGIAEVAAEDWKQAGDDVRELITAYTLGWNAHLADVGADKIEEWCAGEEWVRPLEPVDVYTYARSIALQASSGAVAGLLATAQPPASGAAVPADSQPAGIRKQPGVDAAADASPGTDPVDDPIVAPAAASNGWAIGSERSTDGGGMLVGNPHFPWEGELRFWEVQLTVPGQLDVYGVQLSGLPGVGIGFTENFGWTHTVSAGNRFTAYKLDLADGDPTSYRYGTETRKLTSTNLQIEVRADDGSITTIPRTIWRSHYGPMLDFPGFGWTDTAAITYRDGNTDNDEFIEQYLRMIQAEDLDEFIDIQRTVTGIPLFNTIAASADGRAWYGDTATVPNLSTEAIAAYEQTLGSDPIVKVAADNGAILLDGSDPLFEWQAVPGARDPGLTPFEEMPVLERKDYVFNANDSYWLANADELIDGSFSPLHGRQGTPRSPRTRENATVLSDTSPTGPSGADGTFTLDELADAAVQNRGFTSRELLADVVKRCTGAGAVTVQALADDEGGEALPAASVDVGPACDVLAAWDGVYDLDRAGPAVWRELMEGFDSAELTDAGTLWAKPFDADDPVSTPSGLAPAPAGGIDPLLVNLARAVQTLDKGGLAVDVALGEVQGAVRNGAFVPIHGGTSVDGTTNVVGYGGGGSTKDPYFDEVSRETLVPGSTLATFSFPGIEARTGYPVANGTSFLFVLNYTEDGPEAKAFLTYSDTADRSDPNYTEATERFSRKEWRDIAFTEADVRAAEVSTKQVKGEKP